MQPRNWVYRAVLTTLICGLLAGSMTDPPALSFANSMAAACPERSRGADAPSVTYATIYPLVMFLRIITAQALVMLLAG